jgi:hypothetical protein
VFSNFLLLLSLLLKFFLIALLFFCSKLIGLLFCLFFPDYIYNLLSSLFFFHPYCILLLVIL